MPTSKTLLTASLMAIGILITTQAHASVLDNHKVVRDERGNIVHASESGTCVRTDWVAGNNACAPIAVVQEKTVYVEPPPPPQVVPQRVDVLSSDEKVVYFPFDSAQLTPDARAKLDTVAGKLSGASSVRGADIVGFADRMGSNSYNQTLSERRANAVHQYLNQQGYLNTRVARTRGLGESHSVTACNPKLPRQDQIACLGADRRVELEVQYTETKVENKIVQPTAYAPPVEGDLVYSQPAPATPATY